MTPRLARPLAALGAVAALTLPHAARAQAPAAAAASPASSRAPFAVLDSGTTAFVGVTVIPMDTERRLADQTVVVRAGRIVALGPSGRTKVPDGARRIDARGKFLIPGLVDMHGHMAPDSAEGAGRAGPAARQFATLVANGVTTVRGLIAPPGYLATRERARSGEIQAPAMWVAGPSLNGQSVGSPAAGARMVREAKAAGYDGLKIHGGVSREAYDSIVAAAERAGLPLVGHVTPGYGLARALEAGQQVEHLDGYLAASVVEAAGVEVPGGQVIADPVVLAQIDTARFTALAETTKRAGVANGPTLALFEAIFGAEPVERLAARPEMRYAPRKAVEAWSSQVAGIRREEGGDGTGLPQYLAYRRQLVRALQKAGAPIVASSDSPQLFMVAGFALHREIQALAAAGLTPFQALSAATRTPAEWLGQQNEIGTIAVGRRADLVLLDADPLADVAAASRPAGVMLRGRWLPASELRSTLDGVERALGNGN
jgi:imidazolonepropionase-like amidohydrolase